MNTASDDLIKRYRQRFGVDPEIIVSAPGRVNLIGEHTDYNDGFVLPVAINRRITIAAGARGDKEVRFISVDANSEYRANLENAGFDPGTPWANYLLGVIEQFHKAGHSPRGMNFFISGNIPMGAGLSSSAALEVACAFACDALYGSHCSPSDIIALTRRAETDFVGVRCGVMDQFASVMAKRGHALFLDCRSLEFEWIPCPGDFSLIVCDTGLRRSLIDSAYNRRQAECGEAARMCSQLDSGIRSLRDVSAERFASLESRLPLVPRMRARHVISENDRVIEAVTALRENNLPLFGELMVDSHRSLRDNFEVSCRELDQFVEIAIETEGVFGARMTGAGFGGSGICIVHDGAVDTLVDRLRLEYPRRVGSSLTIYLVSTDDGAAIGDAPSLLRNPIAFPS